RPLPSSRASASRRSHPGISGNPHGSATSLGPPFDLLTASPGTGGPVGARIGAMTARRIPEGGAVHDEQEIEAVVEVLRTTTLDLGERVAEFERQVAELLAKRHGVMVNSGTSALRLAIDLLDCQPGDEVITSILGFSSDFSPLVQSGIVPVLVDVEPDTYQIDPERI